MATQPKTPQLKSAQPEVRVRSTTHTISLPTEQYDALRGVRDRLAFFGTASAPTGLQPLLRVNAQGIITLGAVIAAGCALLEAEMDQAKGRK